MVILENNKYVVSLPEYAIYQDINPDKGGATFTSQAEAQAWEDVHQALMAAAASAAAAAATAQAAADSKAAQVAALKAQLDTIYNTITGTMKPRTLSEVSVGNAAAIGWVQ